MADWPMFSAEMMLKRILKGRKKAGLTQGAVAKAAGIRQETLSRIEHGHGNPTVDIVSRIALAIEKLDKRSLAERTIKLSHLPEARKKTVKVELFNSDLNALEDLLYCILTKKEKRIAEEKVKRLWNSLVGAWDKPLGPMAKGME